MIAANITDRLGRQLRFRVLPFALLVGCEGADCILIPCAPATAIFITVRAAHSGDSDNATIALSGVWTTTFACKGACTISGPPGTYILDVSAPGYTTQHQSIRVDGVAGSSCGCASPEPRKVDLMLVAASS